MDLRIQTKQDVMYNIISRLEKDEINLEFQFQRNLNSRWSRKKMSHLIESLLIRLPLPAFYFVDAGDKWDVLDGVQRLVTIKQFVVEQEFRLSGLEFLPELNGFAYEDLLERQKRIVNEAPVTVHIVQQDVSDTLKWSIFERVRRSVWWFAGN